MALNWSEHSATFYEDVDHAYDDMTDMHDRIEHNGDDVHVPPPDTSDDWHP